MGDESPEEWPSYGTSEEKEYKFREIKGKSLRFSVKAAHDAHLAFTTADEATDPMFEIFIGAWDGAASAIRFNNSDELGKADTPDVLNADEVREFWVSFDHDEVRVGKGGEWEPFLTGTLPQPVDVTHYGYSTGWGAEGLWQFFSERRLLTEDCLTYNYEPVYGNTLTISVSCANDCRLALTSAAEDTEPMYEIFIGGWKNQHSGIRLNKGDDMAKVDTADAVCSEEMRTFWVSFKDGHIKVGNQGSADPFMEWTDPEPWKITHFGYCTGWGASGKWNLEV